MAVNNYPDATYLGLRDAIAEHTGFDPECVVLTGGADEAVQLCALLALRPGDEAYVRRPFYSWYGNATRLAGATLVHEPSPAVRLWWSCVPHNPTGADATDDDLRERDGLVVIDQAYVEFGGRDLSPLVRERSNTVVIRTFSKAFALAGARIGYILAPPAIAHRLDAIRPPASISSFSVALAAIALREAGEMRARAAATVAERDRMAKALRAAGLGVAGLVRELPARRPRRAGGPGLEAAARSGPRRAHVRRPARLRPTSASARRRPPTTTRSWPRWALPPERRRRRRRDAESATAERRTAETDVRCRVALDGSGRSAVTTGIGMLDHMLTALSTHSLIDLELTCTGDLWVDEHHTVEDVAIVLGQALDAALGDRAGIARFGDARAPARRGAGACDRRPRRPRRRGDRAAVRERPDRRAPGQPRAALLRHARAERPPRHPHHRRGRRRPPRARGGVQGAGARAAASPSPRIRGGPGAVPSTKGSL